jgi:hypothetical protein
VGLRARYVPKEPTLEVGQSVLPVRLVKTQLVMVLVVLVNASHVRWGSTVFMGVIVSHAQEDNLPPARVALKLPIAM